MTEDNEKIILEAKLKAGSNQKDLVAKLDETHAVSEIAKSLIQDYTFVLTITTIKAVFGRSNGCKELLDGLTQVWEGRMSAQIGEETKNYQDAIQKAFQDQTEITEETSQKIKKYMEAYCLIRDKAIEIAKNAVNDINKMILDTQTANTDKTEEK